jgi:dipeptidyl aminopeptidase/acylaminoacyl peptidase
MMPAKSFIKPNRFSRRYWLRLIAFTTIVLTIAFLSLLVYFVNLQVKVFVTPKRNINIGSPAKVSPIYEEITLTTTDGLKLSGWYVPGPKPNAIVLVHGIHANRKAVMPEATILAEAGYHLLMFDLRGHGQSEGEIVTYGYLEALDVQAAVDYLVALPGVEQIGALGTSLGGAAVARAAAADPRIKAVVIESSYSSMPDAIEDAFEDLSIFPQWPFAPLIVTLAERRVGLQINEVNSARDLATLSPRAVFIIHGTKDELFPLYHAQKMYEAAQAPKQLWLIEGLGHDNPVRGREEEYRERVVTFFETAFASQ